MKIVLASSSIRRRQLLGRLLENFDVFVSDFKEDSVRFEGDCGKYVMELALGKAKNVCSKLKNEQAIIIGCDTVVYLNGKILGKPENENDAFNMLKALSGNEHQVYSGIAVIDKTSGTVKSDFVKTVVKFSDISDDQIKKYLKRGEYKDKAGAYGIQGYAGVFVSEIHGCYYNVVGLPLNRLYQILTGMGVNL
ncbi:septum formation protein [Clostridium algifaecis]|uniref:dTTP/UTP pyrophosphatase n=1 Tax=Clostridium algifaecis TaxID=1472040 RepID=A0ABS4KSH8_9CLOT|nr:Maf-like protein [Clostridium algifaecis]MBP2032988.1 septum formation protein [Clostridium algifaecis]